MNTLVRIIIMICSLAALFGCGGGGSGGGGSSAANVPQQSSTAVLKLYTEGSLPAGTSIGGIRITVNLPYGFTVKPDADGNVGSDVVSGNLSDYEPATTTVPGKLSLVYSSTDPAGSGTGNFATVNCDIISGTTPDPAKITLSDFKSIDLKGNPIDGLTASVTVDMK